MNPRHNRSAKIDFLQLSASERNKFIKETRRALRDRVEKAKLSRTLRESDGIGTNGEPIVF
jgi:hypothetical protein